MAKSELRPIRVEGNLAYITLTKGYEAVIDAADISLVFGCNWGALVKPTTVYAVRSETKTKGRRRKIYMHRIIMNAPKDMQVDHIDGQGINNTRANLRLATNAQNGHNSRVKRNSKSGLKGAWLDKQSGKFRSSILINGQRIRLGSFGTPEEAHAAYCAAAKETQGAFAWQAKT
jgi:hypothetical protein